MEPSSAPKGKRWELLHWLAFVYIGFKVRRTRWIFWGLLYFAIFMIYSVASAVAGTGSGAEQTAIGLMIVAGFISIVHAFLVRNDYLVRLESRMYEATIAAWGATTAG